MINPKCGYYKETPPIEERFNVNCRRLGEIMQKTCDNCNFNKHNEKRYYEGERK